MAKKENQRLRILYILDYLNRHSYEDNPISSRELIDMLARHGIPCDRKAIYADIRALNEDSYEPVHVDILTKPGKGGGFYIGSRRYQGPEIALLISTVETSRFLTERKSNELIKKLCEECAPNEARQLRQRIYTSGRVKNMNESIYYSIDEIQNAIAQNRQITFRYFDWGIDGRRHYREKEYIASPYGLCQDNDNCYLLAYSERHGITNYRVDRMAKIQRTDTPRIPCKELTGKNLVAHVKQCFGMFSGELTSVKLRFDRKLTNAVIDRFGRDILLIPDGEDHFVFTVDVNVSPMFLSWVLGFGTMAQILYPQSVVDRCKELCAQVLAQYTDEGGNA